MHTNYHVLDLKKHLKDKDAIPLDEANHGLDTPLQVPLAPKFTQPSNRMNDILLQLLELGVLQLFI